MVDRTTNLTPVLQRLKESRRMEMICHVVLFWALHKKHSDCHETAKTPEKMHRHYLFSSLMIRDETS